jgi:signal transduction histidine kinase
MHADRPTQEEGLAAVDLAAIGRKAGRIDVRIGYKIIELFSEGLYSSATKAIEELVSNSFDAGAQHVRVILPTDLADSQAAIAVIDDGEGMDPAGFRQHWIIGDSNKRESTYVSPRGRKQIGKFGIGKLATYVLANRLTHISKKDGRYYAVTMDFRDVPKVKGKESMVTETVPLDLRELNEAQAKAALEPWITSDDEGYKALRLFGPKAASSWTAAVMSQLKDMAVELQRGRLRWILETAMPLRDDFHLYLDGTEIVRAKLKRKRVGRWVLGKDVVNLPAPAPQNAEASLDSQAENEARFGVQYPKLGRVSGYVETYADPLDTGKSEETERSNGFFVYVRGRLVNIEDPGFGIDRNLLRHGTFSRFRMVIHADSLDEELRSSREALRKGVLFNIVRNIAYGGFNLARAKLDEHARELEPGAQVSRRVAGTAGALTRRPLAAVLKAAFEGTYEPRYVSVPANLTKKQQSDLVTTIGESTEGAEEVVRSTSLVELSANQPFAVLDIATGVLQINMLHPFVAYFLDEYEDEKTSVPLELIAASEVFLEADLVRAGLDSDQIEQVLDQRDALLRQLAKGEGRQNAMMVAQALEDAATDQRRLEETLVLAFDSIGFDAVPLGGSKKADGLATAFLSGHGSEKAGYKVTLEAKSKEKVGAKVANEHVRVSTIARHREDQGADHAVVVGPDFPTKDPKAALVTEMADNKKQTKKTITLIRIVDMGRLVRLVPLKRVGLNRLRDLFGAAATPAEAHAWIEALAAEKPAAPPYREILDAIHEVQRDDPTEVVQFPALRNQLRLKHNLKLTPEDLLDLCRAMERFVPELVSIAGTASIEIYQRPDKIMKALSASIKAHAAVGTGGQKT